MKAIRGLFAAILFATAGILPSAWATSFSTDQSDVWAVTGEDGWGFQHVQRDSVIFTTMYVYDPTNIPIWYTATLEYAGNLIWTGVLYETEGPWFASLPFNPVAVTYRNVGTMTWTATSVTTGELRYTVDGVLIVKNATRLLLRYDDFSGHYGGGFHQTVTGCVSPGFNGTFEDIGTLDITQNGQAISLANTSTTGGTCTYNGILTQAGQMGSVAGNYVCSTGEAGSFLFYEIQVNPLGVTGRLTANNTTPAGCVATGWFGGIRVTTF